MASVLKELPAQARRASKYDYEKWLDGQIWSLEKGKDFDSGETLAQVIRNYCSRNGIKVSIRSTKNTKGIVQSIAVQRQEGPPKARKGSTKASGAKNAKKASKAKPGASKGKAKAAAKSAKKPIKKGVQSLKTTRIAQTPTDRGTEVVVVARKPSRPRQPSKPIESIQTFDTAPAI